MLLWVSIIRPHALVERFDIAPYSDFSAKWSNFLGLPLFCIDAKFCKKIFVGKLLTRSTRFTCFCTAQTSIFQKSFVNFFRIFRQMFAKFTHFRKNFIEFCSEFDDILSEFRKCSQIFSKMLTNLEFFYFLAEYSILNFTEFWPNSDVETSNGSIPRRSNLST